MHRHLFIVSRDQPGLFSYLAMQFSQEPQVRVMVDRRQRVRRQRSASPDVVDRRQAERRGNRDLSGQLSTLGYAFVRLL